MVQVCFQGPLADPRIVAAIDPAIVPQQALVRARLTGGDTVVPGLAPDGQALPVLLADLDAEAMARLHYVAQVFGLEEQAQAAQIDGAAVAAVAFAPADPDPGPWAEAEHLGWAAILVPALDEILSYLGTLEPAEAAGRLPMILARAASKATAAAAAPKPLASGMGLANVTIHERRRPYSKYFAIEELLYSHARFDGSESPKLQRAVFMAADAVTVLPYDPVRDRVLLVEQVRAGPIARGDATAWILEPVAGRIEPGHSPETTARKEAEEEAGLALSDLHFVGEYYPSTGCVSEYLYSYVAIADLPDSAAGLGGVLAEGEDIRAHILDRTDLMARIDACEIPDGPLILTAYWLERNLARLRPSG